MTKRALIYARVSSDEQGEHGYSIQTQIDAMQKYSDDHGLIVVRVFQENHTGAELDRPELESARAMLERNEADALVVYSSDRLTRNLAHSIILREEFQAAGIELHTVSRGISENTAEGRLTENVEAVIAEYEREKIRERSRRGRRAKAASGKWVGTGYAPFGYKSIGMRKDKELIVDDEEAAIVRLIFQLYLGDDENAPISYTKIARKLTADGIKPPGGAGGPGRGWYEKTVRAVISRRAYIGEFFYAGHTIRLPELAIIEESLFRLAQLRREKNRLLGKRNQKRQYLLSGYIRCSCGSTMAGGLTHRRLNLAYYRCSRQTHYQHLPKCNASHVRADVADTLVWCWLCELLSDDDQLQHGLRRMAERDAAELAPKHERLALVDELIAKAEKKIKRLAAELGDANEAVLEAIRSELKSSGKQRDALASERDRLAAELDQLTITPDLENQILEKAAKLRVSMPDADYETRRFFLDRLNFQAALRRDEEGNNWLDVSCGIAVDGEALPIELPSSCRRPAARRCWACASRRARHPRICSRCARGCPGPAPGARRA